LRADATRRAIAYAPGGGFTRLGPVCLIGVVIACELAEQSNAGAHSRRRVVRARRRQTNIAANFPALFANGQVAPKGIAKNEQVARLLELAELVGVVSARITGDAVRLRGRIAEGTRVGDGAGIGLRSFAIGISFVERTEQNMRRASRSNADEDRETEAPRHDSSGTPNMHRRNDQRALSITRCAAARNRPRG
jgi:hypothetical protein